MDLNAKGKLQEIYQKKQLALPVYDTVRCGGVAHRPLWKSTVTLADGSQYSGDIHETKSKSDASAASYALILLNVQKSLTESSNISETNSSVINSSTAKPVDIIGRTAVLVDVENLPKFIDEISHKLSAYTVYAFIGEHHCLIDKEYPGGVIKIISPSTRPDGTDCCMQVYTGMLLAQEAYDTYFIATRDHYGSALVEMISSSNLGWTPKLARIVTKASQL